MDLIAKLEALEGPSREVDAEIAATIRVVPDFDPSGYKEGVTFEFEPDEDGSVRVFSTFEGKTQYQHRRAAPPYTASTDVALMLVPEGWHGRIWFGPDQRPRQPNEESDVAIWSPDPKMRGSFFGSSGNAATPAIAMCIAALKARGMQ